MKAPAPTARTRLKRRPQRGHYDRDTLYAVLDAGFVCHVGYAIDGQPYVTPTCYWREGDAVYWHGSAASRMLRHLEKGVECCLTVTHLDALVLARSGFNHSINYRSAMLLGRAHKVEDPAEKLAKLEAFVERLRRECGADLRGANLRGIGYDNATLCALSHSNLQGAAVSPDLKADLERAKEVCMAG